MLNKTFCSSPWIHARITNNGDYEYCRWSKNSPSNPSGNIKDTYPVIWFQNHMAPVRKDLLDGRVVPGCDPCYAMEEHGKISGRQKQLLKTGVQVAQFDKTMISSPWISEWSDSLENGGKTEVHVQDWQIDLGNFCNSACLFCHPDFSSRIASEHYRLKLISKMPPPPWCDDLDLLSKFVDALASAPRLQYLHFIGGETLITPAFRKILQKLIDANLNSELVLGFTTNLTVMDTNIVDLLLQFKQIHLGMSIECIDRANDYIRYGSRIESATQIMDSWLDISRDNDWLLQIRTTPTILSISRLHTIYEYAWDRGIAVESCNFLHDPAFMSPNVLPQPYRDRARDNLQSWIDKQSLSIDSNQIVNIRNPNQVHQQLLQDAQSYIRYMDHEPDRSHLLPDLARYLKTMDTNRGNSVLDYLPEYEELLRSAGY